MQQFIRFGLVGALSTIIDLIVLKVLLVLHVPYVLAVAVGFFAGFLNGYYFNSRFVFYKGSRTQYTRYFITSAWGFVLTEGIVILLHGHGGMSPIHAKLVAVVVAFFSNFLLSKFWAFA